MKEPLYKYRLTFSGRAARTIGVTTIKPMYVLGEPSEFGIRVAKSYKRRLGLELETISFLTERESQKVGKTESWPLKRIKHEEDGREE